MNVRTVDPDCPYVPFTGVAHTQTCEPVAHIQLATAVSGCIDPPIFRAVAQDHQYCPLVPCADCR
jgi:hypothetical protein